MKSFFVSAILLSPLWSLSLIAFVPLIAKVLNKNQEMKKNVVCLIYALAFLLSGVLLVFVGFNDKEIFSLKWSAYSSGACLLANTSALISLALFSFNSWIDKKQLTEILFFFSQSLVGLYVFCLSQDLFTAFIGLELLSIPLYINLAMSRKDFFCLEASIKYFVLSAFASIVFLYGLSFIFGATGTLDWNQFVENPSALYHRFFFLGWALVFTGLFFKVALFPFQFWLPDVYQGALTPFTLFMSTGLKSSVVLFLGKILSLPLFEVHGAWFVLALAPAGLLTVFFGNIMALKQKLLKRLFAFSSLAHSGYLIMMIYGLLNTADALKEPQLLFYYLIAYLFLTAGFLTVIQSLESQSSQPDQKDLHSLFKRNPLLAFSLAVFLLGLAGVPPTFGFFAKMSFFKALALSQNWWMIFWGLVASAIGLYYYAKPLVLMLSAKDEKPRPLVLPILAQSLLILLLFFSLFGAFLFGKFF